MDHSLLRHLPSVNQVLVEAGLRDFAADHGHDLIVAAVRAELDDVRARIRSGEGLNGTVTPARIAEGAARRLSEDFRPKLVPVINATGIVLHTNLGRAPMAEEAALAAQQAAQGYLNLEMSLETGKRSSRQDAIREWVCKLTGAEAATAVNNNAAATVLALRALCRDQEVVLSRGQLIEIGGSFRIPDIMAVSGAILKEVGTTNITRLADYEQAIGPNTAALMQIHTSNYRIGGFTKSVSLSDLVALGRKHQVKVIDDVGSGALIDYARFGFEGEPLARDSIAAGADLVLFSGDKLLGGPQAGILAGKKDWIRKIEKDPLMRAFRLDKMTLAALEATLRLYLNEARALQRIPVLTLLETPLETLRQRAEDLASQLATLPGFHARTRSDIAYVGGGSLPDRTMPTWLVEVHSDRLTDDQLSFRLRTGTPALLGRLQNERLLLDVRTIFPRQIEMVVEAFRQVG